MADKIHGHCLVCDAVAIGINFGVPTCMPCKAFFRRNATRLGIQQFICKRDGDCLVTYKRRRSCNCCRLAKCFRVGMDKSLILSDEEREARNKLVEMNRLKRGKIPKLQCIKWMQPPYVLRMTISKSSQYLSSSDQTLLSNIFHAHETVFSIKRNDSSICIPTPEHISLHDYANQISHGFQNSIEYLKCIPEFARINTDDKIRLVKNHFGIVANMNGPIMQSTVPNNVMTTWMTIFGAEITHAHLKSNQLLQAYIFDPVLLKIIVIILVLSSGSPRNLGTTDIDQICDEPLTIFAAQNVYVELLWRYILSRSASEQNAVKFYSRLITCILYWKKLSACVDEYVDNLASELKQMNPLIQDMWPKQAEVEDITDMNVPKKIII
ncbi:unnamed protein product [Adineta steineri]|uniref:Nuclear receptor domain-containing protein n=1 Tax=Adineta steineri TaxID=433720 RepID=A0A813Y3D6_9BILA|nr:unnamed protein product [Adineta steineri]